MLARLVEMRSGPKQPEAEPEPEPEAVPYDSGPDEVLLGRLRSELRRAYELIAELGATQSDLSLVGCMEAVWWR
jgi:hypothetical protein